ncbi:MAG: 50S ribosomal protein L31 [bacterium]
MNKKDIPYYSVVATCVCGASFETGSTMKELRVDICSNCHPFFTGEKRFLDTEGRVDKFRKKYNLSS